MKSLKRTWQLESWYILFVLPGLLLFLFAVVVPLAMGFKYSFTNWDGLSDKFRYIGWDNYVHAVTDSDFWRALINTFKYAIILTLLVNVIALLLALVLDQFLKFRNIFRTIFFLPSVISIVLSGFIWSYNYSKGLPNLFHLFGNDNVTSPLGNPSYALWGIIVIAVWQGIGTPMIIFIAGLQNIPAELVESAKMDGAGVLHTFRHVTLPLIAPSVTINMVLVLTGALKVFDLVYVTTNGGPAFSTDVLSTFIYRASFTSLKGGYATALSMIFFLILVVVTLVQLQIFRKKEVEI
ncbi:sugar ABC transporter permease [Paenibacillus marchantiophytorum]|uniref:Sugar ABC transporter permease n=1 Tax=Paenibacillus marchantiophytorum TaxID=1619310 RepID=A0ABQ2BPH4_9BACL|nr:sugar ABC transporter permease [Paenibacillus marchantiophytorum]GGI44503.1 sugar ABC transporter permease [Paenibacillus marchantiophytorum]